jgi:hypothetical protein
MHPLREIHSVPLKAKQPTPFSTYITCTTYTTSTELRTEGRLDLDVQFINVLSQGLFIDALLQGLFFIDA